MRPDELDETAIRSIYHQYSNDDKGFWGELCAFRATWKIVRIRLVAEPRFYTLPNGDLNAFFRRRWDDPDEWTVSLNEPSRNRQDVPRDRPDITVFCNEIGCCSRGEELGTASVLD